MFFIFEIVLGISLGIMFIHGICLPILIKYQQIKVPQNQQIDIKTITNQLNEQYIKIYIIHNDNQKYLSAKPIEAEKAIYYIRKKMPNWIIQNNGKQRILYNTKTKKSLICVNSNGQWLL